jgi:hypothetical protein
MPANQIFGDTGSILMARSSTWLVLDLDPSGSRQLLHELVQKSEH